jgi:hypothetical protein
MQQSPRTRDSLRRSRRRKGLFLYKQCPVLTVGTGISGTIRDGYIDTTVWAD